MSLFTLSQRILDETFAHFRGCGRGRHECQILWVSPWDAPETITHAIHPKHRSHLAGFELDDGWLNDFWYALARENLGIRIQVHTHPAEAFHSSMDDAFPIIQTAGFLSLVIPNFALGPTGFDEAYLTEIQNDGRWQEVVIADRILLT